MTNKLITGVQLKYGAQPDRMTSLHEMFFDARGKKLIYRSETADSVVEPFCVYCTQEYSIAAMENCKGRCLYCASCPLCKAGLTKTLEPPYQYICQTCRWESSSSGLTITDKSDAAEGEEALKDLLLELEESQTSSSAFDVLTSLLRNLSSTECKLGTPTPSSPSLLRTPSARFKKPEGMAMGLDRASLIEFENRLENDRNQKQSSGIRSLSVAETAWSQQQEKSEQLLLPTRQELVVRSAVRYQRHLLAAEVGSDGSRRLNRNAAAMLPRLLIANSVRGKGIEPFNVIIAMVSPSTYPIYLEEISCVASTGCTVEVPVLSDAVCLDAKPETESHKTLYHSPSDLQPAGLLSKWDNCALISLVLTPPEKLLSSLDTTLCLTLKHSVDGEENKTLLYAYIYLNVDTLSQ